MGMSSILQWQTPCGGCSRARASGGDRRSQSYRPQLRPCSTPCQQSARIRSGVHVRFGRRQVLDPKAPRERARLLAARPRVRPVAQRRADGDLPNRLRDDEREEARVDGDVEGRVAVWDERGRDEEDAAEDAHRGAPSGAGSSSAPRRISSAGNRSRRGTAWPFPCLVLGTFDTVGQHMRAGDSPTPKYH